MSIVSTLAYLRKCSAEQWAERAEEAPDATMAEEIRGVATQCLDHYDTAVQCLREQYAGWAHDARSSLAYARQLETDAGDSTYSDMAIQELEEYMEEVTE